MSQFVHPLSLTPPWNIKYDSRQEGHKRARPKKANGPTSPMRGKKEKRWARQQEQKFPHVLTGPLAGVITIYCAAVKSALFPLFLSCALNSVCRSHKQMGKPLKDGVNEYVSLYIYIYVVFVMFICIHTSLVYI